jgi:Anti-sigma factor NepR
MYLAAQRRCPSGRRPVERRPDRCSTTREIRDFLTGKTDGEDLLHALYDHVLDEPVPERLTALLRR